MELLHAIFLGIVEGLTEFLPISSTAHLILSERLLNFKDQAELFTVVIQFGAIVAAGWFFRADIISLVRGLIQKQKSSYVFALNIIIGLLPAAIIGLIIEKTIGLTDSVLVIALSLVIGGIILWLIELRYGNQQDNEKTEVAYDGITAKQALMVGLSQCLAIIPGVSRSGVTIGSGLLVGLNRQTATAFSFFLSIPIMAAASGLKLISDRSSISSLPGGYPALIIGTLASFITAFVAVRWLLKYVQKNNFKPFAYYRIALGTLLLIALATHSLAN